MRINNIFFICIIFILSSKSMDLEFCENSTSNYASQQDFTFFNKFLRYENFESKNLLENIFQEILKINIRKDRNDIIRQKFGNREDFKSLYNKLLLFIWDKEFGITSADWQGKPDLEDTINLVMIHRKNKKINLET